MYRMQLEQALARLDPGTHATVVELAELPDAIRGSEAIKLRSVAAARARAETLLGRLQSAAVTAGTS